MTRAAKITAAADPDRLHTQTSDELPPGRVRAGRILIWLASAVLVLTFLLQALHASGADVPGLSPGVQSCTPTCSGLSPSAPARC